MYVPASADTLPCERGAHIARARLTSLCHTCRRRASLQDENQETAEKCKISSMPTFQFYKHGKLVHQFSGASEDQLLKSIAQHK